MEIYKDIEGYEGYQVSNYGRVKSLDRYVYDKIGRKQHIKEKIIKAGKHKSGHLHVCLFKDNKRYLIYVHRLVAQHFLPNPDNLLCVNHKDENPLNNHVDNLEWCTYEYNNNYGTRNNRIGASKKGKRRIDLEKPINQYDLDGNFIRRWKSAKEAERTLGFKACSIGCCCRGGFYRKEKWINVKQSYGYIWKYA